MHRFVRELITEWRRLKLPVAGTSLVTAVSGGADSVGLLLALADLKKRSKLDLEIIVAHFNHALRPDANKDEQFVRNLTKELGFEFMTARMAPAPKHNIEQTARRERYLFLRNIASKRDSAVVLTAHTQNDQAETFLMNLIRGSGRDGLASMRQVGPLPVENGPPVADDVKLVRPLIAWAKRDDTEAFCKFSNIEYRSDTMNDDLRFTRVRIRKEIIPMLRQLNPKIVETLASTAELLRETPKIPFENDTTKGDPLELRHLRGLIREELFSRLRHWLRTCRGSLRGLGLKHIESIERLIHSRKSGRMVELPARGCVVKRGGRLYFEQIMVEK
ncbi:MAG: tRNA lysidine(34) synthetase TilS [Acidobacteriota bacterium]